MWCAVRGYSVSDETDCKFSVNKRMSFYMDESTGTKNIAEISKTAAAYNRLYETIGILRAPGGCPWDRDQTPLSMRRDLVEEVFEAVDAVSQNDSPHIKEELGDVILNATLIAYMYEQSGIFSVAEVLNNLCDKLIRRHPHVFPESACLKLQVILKKC